MREQQLQATDEMKAKFGENINVYPFDCYFVRGYTLIYERIMTGKNKHGDGKLLYCGKWEATSNGQ